MADGLALLADVKKLAQVHADMSGQLSERGAQEHRMLARRMATRTLPAQSPSPQISWPYYRWSDLRERLQKGE